LNVNVVFGMVKHLHTDHWQCSERNTWPCWFLCWGWIIKTKHSDWSLKQWSQMISWPGYGGVFSVMVWSVKCLHERFTEVVC